MICPICAFAAPLVAFTPRCNIFVLTVCCVCTGILLRDIRGAPGAGRGLDVTTTMLTGAADAAMGPGLEKAPTGIPGLDQITEGGLPRGRVSLVAGSAGAGKTLLGVEFLVAGARQYGEPGVLVSFEESEAKVTRNVRSLGFDLDQLRRDGLLAMLSFQVDPSEIVAAGEFDFEPLFAV